MKHFVFGYSVMFLLLLLVLGQTSAQEDSEASAMAQPSSLDSPLILAAEELEKYPFTPCATWANGGISWVKILNHENSQEGEWWVVVWQPVWRFCGLPQPAPPIPAYGSGIIPQQWIEQAAESASKLRADRRERVGIWERTPTPEGP